ncbi:glycosyltransferase family 39 protein [Vagococcus vulneris]|uniref:Glycosyltransferase RgtA/B/C/D-like domain-containing protein n=1 Tax=Vagococcus vulneris TaxID=1977869 RepID=A0A429ZX54_9ENTE|nr:glycosyltransferase family 39 protein [Vagococcus vulneris]RST98318.1 hypothetical protein CBF37_08390 [Vagococcus vulneris]
MRIKDKFTNRISKSTVYLILFFGVLSSFFLGIVSKNSPLYYFNDWVDVNAFFTMGRAWHHGLIPYQDLAEQKGPILFFIYRIAAVFSDSYFGIYILEIISLTWTSMILYKIGRHFFNSRKTIAMVLISYLVLLMSPFFKQGGGVEELSFVPIMYSIYLIIKAQKQHLHLSVVDYFLSGIALGYLFWSKYTMIGSWIGFYLSLAICLLINKDFRELLKAVIFSIVGFLIVTLPIVIYFIAVKGWNALLFNYFYVNIFLYPSESKSGPLGALFNACLIFVEKMMASPITIGIFLIGFLALLLSQKILSNNYSKFMYASAYFMLIISTFYGGKVNNYYFLILLPFGTMTILLLMTFVNASITKLQLFFVAIFCLVVVIGMSENTKSSKFYPSNQWVTLDSNDSEYAQEKFAKIIKKEKNPTLLNYGFLDGGFYEAAGILPSVKYFHKQNIAYNQLPEMMDIQNKAVNEKKVDFIVVRNEYQKPVEESVPKNIRENYRLVSEHSQFFERKLTYRLYKLK